MTVAADVVAVEAVVAAVFAFLMRLPDESDAFRFVPPDDTTRLPGLEGRSEGAPNPGTTIPQCFASIN